MSVFKTISVLFALGVLALGFGLAAQETKVLPEGSGVRITLEGAITPTATQYVKDAIGFATKHKAPFLIINMDTPGGLLEATRQMVQAMLLSEVPIIVYVTPEGARAGSAGVFITLAAHVAAMAPSTHIGAAHPVGIGGGDVQGDMKKKIENDTVAWVRSLAERYGRNADWAAKAVLESASISENEALKLKVVDLIARNEGALLKEIHGRMVTAAGKKITLKTQGVVVTEFEKSGRQKLVEYLSDPNLLYILMLLGALGLFIEFQSPGLIIPGVLGALCLAVVFGVQILPVNWLGAVLMLFAIALLVAEIYITSFGLLTAGGLILLIVGSYLLFDVDGSMLQVAPMLIWSFSALFALMIFVFGVFMLKAKRQGATSNVDALAGKVVEVLEAVGKDLPGTIMMDGTQWDAFSDDDFSPGEAAVVVKVDSTKVWIKKTQDIQE